MQKFIVKITEENDALIQDDALECYLLTSSLSPAFVRKFAGQASAAGKIVLSGGEEAARMCRDYNLDGLLLDLSKAGSIRQEFDKARKTAGKDAVIGIISRSRRHEAMIASECEPDFLAFGVWQDGYENTAALLKWYSELFLIQSAADIRDENVDFAGLTADIVILNDSSYKILVAKKQSLD